MTRSNAQARRHLDARFERLRPLLREPRPPRGWVRAIRDALGMSSPELARRMGVSQSTVASLERSEAAETINAASLRRAAEALDCEVVYFLVPRRSLEESARAQARRKASQHLAAVVHHGRLEDQAVTDDDLTDQIEELATRFADRRGLWTDDRT